MRRQRRAYVAAHELVVVGDRAGERQVGVDGPAVRELVHADGGLLVVVALLLGLAGVVLGAIQGLAVAAVAVVRARGRHVDGAVQVLVPASLEHLLQLAPVDRLALALGIVDVIQPHRRKLARGLLGILPNLHSPPVFLAAEHRARVTAIHPRALALGIGRECVLIMIRASPKGALKFVFPLLLPPKAAKP